MQPGPPRDVRAATGDAAIVKRRATLVQRKSRPREDYARAPSHPEIAGASSPSRAENKNQRANLFARVARMLALLRAQNFRLTSRRPDRIKESRTSLGLLFAACVVGENRQARLAVTFSAGHSQKRMPRFSFPAPRPPRAGRHGRG